jgi:hypothetical protein
VSLIASPVQGADDATIFTLWPFVDYRHDRSIDYQSVHLLGPLIKYERKGREREFALRPLFYQARDEKSGVRLSEYLYPLASSRRERDQSFFQTLHLLEYDIGSREEGSDNEFMLFPFLFYGDTEDKGEYFAFVPFGGKIYNRLWRDEIRFALFPLYGQTRKNGTEVTNVLWPFFARIEGENETGTKIWPFYGRSEKEGVYRKRFVLWPFHFDYRLKLNTDNPVTRKAFFPFYITEESPQLSRRFYLWPFFSHVVDRRRGYEEWNFPWPLVRHAQGEYKESRRFLPFYSYERSGAIQRRWILWPVYLQTELDADELIRRRDRILFFLFSHTDERQTFKGETYERQKRIALWPLFFFEREKGVSHLRVFSLLAPILPENEAIRRNWSPLWSIYQRKWDRQGNEVSSLFWNLYWKERRGEDLAFEVFPLVRYRREQGRIEELSVLKGLLRYSVDKGRRHLALLFTPWGFSWGADAD